MRDEAELARTDAGTVPADTGWFIQSLSDLAWETGEHSGTWLSVECPTARNPDLGFGFHVLGPGDSTGLYHEEGTTESFVVLAGSCRVIVEGEERPLRTGDVFHSPPGTAHILLGGDDGPCTLVMAGARRPEDPTRYLPDDLAASYGAAVGVETDDPKVAYAGRPPFKPARSPWSPAR